MKSSLFSKFMTLMTAVLLAAGAYAAGAAHKGSLEVTDPILVNGKQVMPGNYTVVWEGDGPQANLRIMKGKKEIANAPCTVVPLDKKASDDAAEVTVGATGKELTALRFYGQKYELNVAGATSQAGMKSGNSVK